MEKRGSSTQRGRPQPGGTFTSRCRRSGDGADAVRERRGHDRGVEALARFQHEDRPKLLGHAALQGSEHQVG